MAASPCRTGKGEQTRLAYLLMTITQKPVESLLERKMISTRTYGPTTVQMMDLLTLSTLLGKSLLRTWNLPTGADKPILGMMMI